MTVTIRPDGIVTLTGRQKRKMQTFLQLALSPMSDRQARNLIAKCNSASRPGDQPQLFLRWNLGDELEAYFRRDDATTGLRVLSGETILRVMNNRVPHDIGDFGAILYERAAKRLRAAGKLNGVVQGYAALEALFLTAVTAELPIFFANWKGTRPFSESDEVFIRIMTRDLAELPVTDGDGGEVRSIPSGAALRSGCDGAIQLGLPLEEGELLERLTARVKAMKGICGSPLIHDNHAPREPRGTAQSPAKVKKAIARSGRKHGYFVAFTGETRPIPLLHPHTVQGLAKAENVLQSRHRFTKDDFRRLAKAAADHRCKSGVGGPLIADESAELYVRIFRGMLLTEEDVSTLSTDDLCELTRLAANLHRLDAPADTVQ